VIEEQQPVTTSDGAQVPGFVQPQPVQPNVPMPQNAPAYPPFGVAPQQGGAAVGTPRPGMVVQPVQPTGPVNVEPQQEPDN
jgi:hypothetical protein